MDEARKESTRWWKVAAAVAVLVLIGWIFTVGLGHGGGSTATTPLRLHTTP